MSLELMDYRRQVFAHYAKLRSGSNGQREKVAEFRAARDDLFKHHSQSALNADQKEYFSGLEYFDYDAQWRKMAELDYDIDQTEVEVALREDGNFRMRPYARATFKHGGIDLGLTLYWINGYGGGLFLPFRDLGRMGEEIYGGSRYLLDTIKGADLGMQAEKIILDFNYAYNPSCAYNESWDCPLAPQENWLELEVLAGEKKFPQ